MTVNGFLVATTMVIVVCMQVASGFALWLGTLEFTAYAAIWALVLTLVMGFWFRGSALPTAA